MPTRSAYQRYNDRQSSVYTIPDSFAQVKPCSLRDGLMRAFSSRGEGGTGNGDANRPIHLGGTCPLDPGGDEQLDVAVVHAEHRG